MSFYNINKFKSKQNTKVKRNRSLYVTLYTNSQKCYVNTIFMILTNIFIRSVRTLPFRSHFVTLNNISTDFVYIFRISRVKCSIQSINSRYQNNKNNLRIRNYTDILRRTISYSTAKAEYYTRRTVIISISIRMFAVFKITGRRQFKLQILFEKCNGIAPRFCEYGFL